MRKHVTPAHPRASIPDPSRGRDLPPKGMPVEWSVYWARLEARGDVTVSEIAEEDGSVAATNDFTPEPPAGLDASAAALETSAEALSEAAERLAGQPAPTPVGEPVSAPAPANEPASGTTASVPFMITKAMRTRLAGLGKTEDEIRTMTPEQANELLAQARA